MKHPPAQLTLITLSQLNKVTTSLMWVVRSSLECQTDNEEISAHCLCSSASHFSTTFLSCLTSHAKSNSKSCTIWVIPKPDAIVSSRLFLLSSLGLLGGHASMSKSSISTIS